MRRVPGLGRGRLHHRVDDLRQRRPVLQLTPRRFAAALLGAVALGAAAIVALGFGGRLWFPLDLLAHFRLHAAALSGASGVAALALGARRRGLAGLAAAALGVAGLGAALAQAERAAAPGPTRALTVAVANVDIFNPSPETAAAALAALDADVLVTLESLYAFREADGPLRERYPGVVNRVRYVYTGNWLWTDLPVLDGGKIDVDADSPAQVWARLDLGGGATLDVLGLHFRRPVFEPQEAQIAGLRAGLPEGLGRPLVALGDFNATPWSAAVRRVADALDLSLVGGLRFTWRSRDADALGPLGRLLSLPIDHVLVEDGIGVSDVRTAPIPGSDHRAVVARVAIPVRASAAGG